MAWSDLSGIRHNPQQMESVLQKVVWCELWAMLERAFGATHICYLVVAWDAMPNAWQMTPRRHACTCSLATTVLHMSPVSRRSDPGFPHALLCLYVVRLCDTDIGRGQTGKGTNKDSQSDQHNVLNKND